ncbi:hypothetical protein LJU45_00015 [Klebsiella pneumoniae]|uniref:hypothetical protein n=1 Tax=Klebsiella pneumoniae TaxID=573 RepID=UPI001D0FB8CB|nr:hypothetical protein [Klebsiella pneumoniae]UDV27614.1 hypothetical protein LJU45_00015 [Klebsiella pneumoniae]
MTMYYIRKEEDGVYAVSTTDLNSIISGDWPDAEYFEYAMAALGFVPVFSARKRRVYPGPIKPS